jgi:D-alanyl-D-alanine carboxypeptidase/D-alanyl-D-alanine-endopeptidase (penicillin-binding protein 4)
MVRLLQAAAREPWAKAFRTSLPTGDQGTLEHRLRGVRVRAKTGTLASVSALSGYVFLRRAGRFAQFSILSRGLPKSRAVRIEDRIVRILSHRATG